MVAKRDAPKPLKVSVRDLRLSYGAKEVIKGISFDIPKNDVFAIIGPAQSGKSSLLRCLNRTIEFIPDAKLSGSVEIDGKNVDGLRNVYELRRRVGEPGELGDPPGAQVADEVVGRLVHRLAPGEEPAALGVEQVHRRLVVRGLGAEEPCGPAGGDLEAIEEGPVAFW